MYYLLKGIPFGGILEHHAVKVLKEACVPVDIM